MVAQLGRAGPPKALHRIGIKGYEELLIRPFFLAGLFTIPY
jgi:hypothetical protein